MSNKLKRTSHKSRDTIWQDAQGVISWNLNPQMAGGGNSGFATQIVFGTGVPYRAGQVVTNLGWAVQTAAAGTNPTSIFQGLTDANGAMLMGSANLAASTAWTTAGLRTAALSSPYTITSDDLYYHVLLIDGTFSVTQPLFTRGANLGTGGRINAAGRWTHWTGATVGQTALPAIGASIVGGFSLNNTPQLYFSFAT